MNFLSSPLRRWGVCIGLIGIASASISGCGGGSSSSNNNGGGGGGGGGSTSQGGNPAGAGFSGRAVCQANAHQSGRKRWTVLVYINAANDLQPYSLTNVAQMASVGSDANNLNIVIQWKQSNSCDPSIGNCGNPSFIGTRRYLLKQHSSSDVTQIQNGNTTVLDPDRLADPATNVSGTSDMGDYHVLQNFLQWGSSTYPADNLALVIWDHGAGWRSALRSPSLKKTVPQKMRSLSQDYSTGNEIETQELPLGLAGPAQPLDMLIVDCSLEQMAEIEYQVRSSAKVMVGSEESPPGPGYPYDAWLNDLKSNGANPCVVGQSIVDRFIASYQGSSYTDLTQSVIDLTQMNGIATALNAFGASLLSHLNDQKSLLTSARTNVQAYGSGEAPYTDNKDLYNYAELIRSQTTASDLKTAAYNMEAAISGSSGAVMYSKYGSTQEAGSCGTAIWIPSGSAGSNDYNYYLSNITYAYPSLALSQAAPNWPAFLAVGP